jgi:hypothetical protein
MYDRCPNHWHCTTQCTSLLRWTIAWSTADVRPLDELVVYCFMAIPPYIQDVDGTWLIIVNQ